MSGMVSETLLRCRPLSYVLTMVVRMCFMFDSNVSSSMVLGSVSTSAV